jgi:hypothetical protein
VTTALAFYNEEWFTEVSVDASPVGLGAVLGLINPENKRDRKVIMYVSRLLSAVERRYSQVEKEALAVVWACERLFLYLWGRRFRLVTDNRAVELIFRNPNSDPPLRIKRWALRLTDFVYEIVHRPGATNIADYLSRHPLEPADEYDDTESYVAFVVQHNVSKSFSIDEIMEATRNDRAAGSGGDDAWKDGCCGRRTMSVGEGELRSGHARALHT